MIRALSLTDRHRPSLAGGQSRDGDRAEFRADAVVHAVGCCLGLVGAVVLLRIAFTAATRGEFVSLLAYVFGLIAMLGLSAAYNMMPDISLRPALRRLDHSAIYLMIAGTYTAVLAQMKSDAAPVALLIAVWITAAIGIALKLLLPGRFERLSVVLYLLLGWSGVLVVRSIAAALPGLSLWLLVAGGILYTIGVMFHLWKRLRFQNAIWHGFVLVVGSPGTELEFAL